jgi:ComEC/Rec2-related protein
LGLGIGIATGLAWWNAACVLLIAYLARGKRCWIFAMVLFCVGFAIAPRQKLDALKVNDYFQGQVTVVSMPRSTIDGYRFVALSGSSRYLVTTIDRYRISLGDELLIRGRREMLSEVSEQHWLDDAVVSQIRVRTSPVVISRGSIFWRWALEVRERVSAAFSSLLSPEDAALADSFLLNETTELDAESMNRLAVSGVAHLIGSVGAKIYFMATCLFWILSKVPLPRWTQTLLILAGLLLYTSACGMTANGMRAFCMCAIFMLCPLLRREFDAVSALACVFVGNILLWPRVIFDVGFQLSTICILGIALFSSDINYWLSRHREKFEAPTVLKHAIVVSGICWLISSPLIAYHQYFVSLSVGLATLCAWIPFILLLGSSAVTLLLASIFPAGAKLISTSVMEPVIHGLRQIADILGSNTFFVPIAPFSAYWLLVIYVLALFIWRPYYRSA